MVQRHLVHSNASWVHVLGGGDGLVQSVCVVLAIVQHHGRDILCRCVGGSPEAMGKTRDIQYRSRYTIHIRTIHEPIGRRSHQDKHGGKRPMLGQYIHRETVVERKI